MGQPSLLDQLSEEALSEVTRAVRIVTAAADVGIERRPVRLAEPLKCNRGLIGEHITRADHHAPVGRGENGMALEFAWELAIGTGHCRKVPELRSGVEAQRRAIKSVGQSCSTAVSAASSRTVSVRGRCGWRDATRTRRRGRRRYDCTFNRTGHKARVDSHDTLLRNRGTAW